MKCIKIFLFLLCIPVSSFCQERDTDYGFINAALKQVEKYDSTFFYLHNRSFPCPLMLDEFAFYLKALKGKIGPEVLRELIGNSRSKTPAGFEFDPHHIDKSSGAILITPVTADSIQRNKDFSIPLNRRFYYICSFPTFDNRKRFAIIDFGGGTARLAMTGKKYLFKREKKDWVLIATFDDWAS